MGLSSLSFGLPSLFEPSMTLCWHAQMSGPRPKNYESCSARVYGDSPSHR